MRACGGSHFQNLTLNFWQFLHSVTIARTPASGEESCSLFLAWVFCSLHQVSPLDSHTAAFQGQPHSGRTTMLSELWQKQLQAARPLTSSLVTQSSAVLHGSMLLSQSCLLLLDSQRPKMVDFDNFHVL